VTKDDVVRALTLNSSDVKVAPSGSPILREQVMEIRIHRDRRLSDALLAPGGKILYPLCGNSEWCFPNPFMLLTLIPVALVSTVAAAPIVVPIAGQGD
jgi:hypothetical protein